jgi:two-component system sensor kinase FixL
MSPPGDTLTFTRERLQELLGRLEALAAGEADTALTLSPLHDELDAIAFGINVLADELRWAHFRVIESERKRSEELREQSLRLSSANFAAAFHSNPCAMTLSRVSDGTFCDANESFERQSGYTRDEVMGRTIEQVGVWIDPGDVMAVSRALQETGMLRSREVRYRAKNGTLRTAVYSAQAIVFSGEPCILAVGLDVTDLKTAEVQASALRNELAHRARVSMVETLTGSIAHEINQPLTAVLANAEAALYLLDRQPESTWHRELRATLVDIRDDSKRTGEVLSRVRRLLKKGPVQHEPERVEINGVVEELAALVQANARGRQVAMELDLAPCIGPVMGDRLQIQQVVLNLLMNAFDAVGDRLAGDRRVRLRTSIQERSAVIEVSDCGEGLSDEALGMIFEPFYTTKPDGMGLGLPLCLTIVHAHGGALTAQRNAEGGMSFSARFPMCVADQPLEGRSATSTVRATS